MIEIALELIPSPVLIRFSFSGAAVAVEAAKGTPETCYLNVSSFGKSVRNSFPLNISMCIGDIFTLCVSCGKGLS